MNHHDDDVDLIASLSFGIADTQTNYVRRVRGFGDLGAYLGGIVNILIAAVSFIFGSMTRFS